MFHNFVFSYSMVLKVQKNSAQMHQSTESDTSRMWCIISPNTVCMLGSVLFSLPKSCRLPAYFPQTLATGKGKTLAERHACPCHLYRSDVVSGTVDKYRICHGGLELKCRTLSKSHIFTGSHPQPASCSIWQFAVVPGKTGISVSQQSRHVSICWSVVKHSILYFSVL